MSHVTVSGWLVVIDWFAGLLIVIDWFAGRPVDRLTPLSRSGRADTDTGPRTSDH